MKTNSPTLKVVPTSKQPFHWNGAPPVASCFADARNGGFYAFLDQKLVEFLQLNVHGAPLGDSTPAPDGDRGIRISGTAHMLTAGTKIASIWEAKTGLTARAYHSDTAWEPETWGSRVVEQMYGWVDAWITSVVGRCRHDDLASIRENVFEALQQAGACEWDWERSRRAMTFGELKANVSFTGLRSH